MLACTAYGIIACLFSRLPIQDPANNDLMAEKMAVLVLWMTTGIGFIALTPFMEQLKPVGFIWLTVLMALIQFTLLGFIVDLILNRFIQKSARLSRQTDEFVEGMKNLIVKDTKKDKST